MTTTTKPYYSYGSRPNPCKREHPSGWLCTRPSTHWGPHVAHDDEERELFAWMEL